MSEEQSTRPHDAAQQQDVEQAARQAVQRHAGVLDGADTSEEIVLNSDAAGTAAALETDEQRRIGASKSNNQGLG